MPDDAAAVPAVAGGASPDEAEELIRKPLTVNVHMDKAMSRNWAWFITLGALQLILLAVILVIGGYYLHSQSELTDTIDARVHLATQGMCAFFGDAATSPPALQSERLSVELIETARTAYTELGCGTLPPPSHQLEELAQKYQIPLTH